MFSQRFMRRLIRVLLALLVVLTITVGWRWLERRSAEEARRQDSIAFHVTALRGYLEAIDCAQYWIPATRRQCEAQRRAGVTPHCRALAKLLGKRHPAKNAEIEASPDSEAEAEWVRGEEYLRGGRVRPRSPPDAGGR